MAEPTPAQVRSWARAHREATGNYPTPRQYAEFRDHFRRISGENEEAANRATQEEVNRVRTEREFFRADEGDRERILRIQREAAIRELVQPAIFASSVRADDGQLPSGSRGTFRMPIRVSPTVEYGVDFTIDQMQTLVNILQHRCCADKYINEKVDLLELLEKQGIPLSVTPKKSVKPLPKRRIRR